MAEIGPDSDQIVIRSTAIMLYRCIITSKAQRIIRSHPLTLFMGRRNKSGAETVNVM